jgi:hypothetical protein
MGMGGRLMACFFGFKFSFDSSVWVFFFCTAKLQEDLRCFVCTVGFCILRLGISYEFSGTGQWGRCAEYSSAVFRFFFYNSLTILGQAQKKLVVEIEKKSLFLCFMVIMGLYCTKKPPKI